MEHKKSRKIMFVINGIHCENCKKRIEEGLNSQKAIKKVTVNLKKSTVEVSATREISTEEIVNMLETLDYPVEKIFD